MKPIKCPGCNYDTHDAAVICPQCEIRDPGLKLYKTKVRCPSCNGALHPGSKALMIFAQMTPQKTVPTGLRIFACTCGVLFSPATQEGREEWTEKFKNQQVEGDQMLKMGGG